VELLVVIAIIGVLTAITIPAVVASVDKARQAQCKFNLKGLAFGVESYYSAKHVMPPLRKQMTTPKGELYSGWVHELMPHLDNDPLATAIRQSYSMGDPQGTALQTSMNLLTCPSDGSENSSDTGSLSYAVNSGRRNNYLGNGIPDRSANGVFMDQITSLGAAKFKPQTLLGSIPDGASNTLLILETLDADVWWKLSELNLTTATAGPNELQNGVIWIPNDVVGKNSRYIDHPDAGKMLYNGVADQGAHPSSNHIQCFHVAFCGGEVRAMRSDLDYKLYAQLMTSDGSQAYDPGITPPANGPVPQPSWQSKPVNEGAY
jgi:type II secretory pathway pseudopilin PulG